MFGKKKKQDEIRLCPSCKQPTLQQATNVSGWLDSALFQCSNKECGYTGRFFIIIDANALKKASEEGEDEETDDGQ